MDQDIRELLSQRQKDRAFEVLLQRYQAKVFRLVYSIVGNSSRAEEVTQDSFLKIWQALAGYDGRASLSTWIYTIAQKHKHFSPASGILPEDAEPGRGA